MDRVLNVTKAITGFVTPIGTILILRGVIPEEEAGAWLDLLTVALPGALTAWLVWQFPNKVIPVVLICVILPLGACAPFESAGAVREVVNVDQGEIVDWNPGQYAGINVLVTRVPLENGNEVILERYDGKEAQTLDVSFKNANGTEITYQATGVKAFEGQKYRADLEAEIARTWPELAPEIRGGIVDLATTLAQAALGL